MRLPLRQAHFSCAGMAAKVLEEVRYQPRRLRAALSRHPLKGAKAEWRRKETPGLPPGRTSQLAVRLWPVPKGSLLAANRSPPAPEGASSLPRCLRVAVCLGSPSQGELPKAERSSGEGTSWPRRSQRSLPFPSHMLKKCKINLEKM